MEAFKIPKPGDISEAWWREVCKRIKKAVAFLDAGVAESLHWHGGLRRLQDAGVTDVKEFSTFETGSCKDEKAVFFIAEPVTGMVKDILQSIIEGSSFKYVIVFTAVHPHVEAYVQCGGKETEDLNLVNNLEEQVLSWMGNMNYTVEIFYYPLVFVPFKENVFLIPRFCTLYPLIESDVLIINRLYHLASTCEKGKMPETLANIEYRDLPLRMRVVVKQFVITLHSLLQSMNAREELFTLGHTAHIIGSELEMYTPARQRRKTARNKVSVLLVDRTLDCVGAATYSDQTVMDLILNGLPRFYGHNVDSAVSLQSLSAVHPSCDRVLLPGCIAHVEDDKGKEFVSASVEKDAKSSICHLKTQLKGVVEDNTGDGDDSVEHLSTAAEMLHFVRRIYAKPELFEQNIGLIEQAMAVHQALEAHSKGVMGELFALQKALLELISNEEDSPLKQIVQLMYTRKKRGLTLEHILPLFVYVASLGGSVSLPSSEEYSVVNMFSQAILEDREQLPNYILNMCEDDIDEVSALRLSRTLWSRLQGLAKARESLKYYRHLYTRATEKEPVVYSNLIKHLIQDCFSAEEQSLANLSDLEIKSTGFKDIIKTGISLFVNVSKPNPRDAPVMIVFVIGGLAPCEIYSIEELLHTLAPGCEVVLGSSHLTYPFDAADKVLGGNKLLHP